MNYSTTAQEIDFAEAVEKKIISTGVIGNGGYNGKCIKLSLISRSSRQVKIKIPAGWIFTSEDTFMQDLMVMKEQLFVINPRSRQSFDLFTMCTQSSNHAPSKGAYFNIGKLAQSHLLKLAEKVSKNKWYQNSTVQSAVWTIANGATIDNIYGTDTAMVNGVVEVVSEATGQPVSAFYTEPREHNLTSINTSMEAFITKDLYSASLRAYDANGTLVREYFNGRRIKKGFFYHRLGLFHTLGDEAKLYLKLEEDGDVISQKEIDVNSQITPLTKVYTTNRIEFELEKGTKATVAVYDSLDNLYFLMKENKQYNQGENISTLVAKTYLPKNKTYYMKIKAGDKTIASQKMILDQGEQKLFPKKYVRGLLQFQLHDDYRGVKVAVFDKNHEKVRTIMDGNLGRGSKRIPFNFYHYRDPKEILYMRVFDKDGGLLAEQCVSNCQ
jgi:hypothetical protein